MSVSIRRGHSYARACACACACLCLCGGGLCGSRDVNFLSVGMAKYLVHKKKKKCLE